MAKQHKDLLVQIIAFEDGELAQDEAIELFQQLVDTGMAWSLQGSYGRMAADLIDQGLIQEGVITERTG